MTIWSVEWSSTFGAELAPDAQKVRESAEASMQLNYNLRFRITELLVARFLIQPRCGVEEERRTESIAYQKADQILNRRRRNAEKGTYYFLPVC